MAKLWLLLIFFATACNVANQPKPLSASGVENTPVSSTTMGFANVYVNRPEGSGVATLVLTMSDYLDVPVTVNYSLSGTATGGVACTAGIDYVNPSGLVLFNPGTRTRVIDIALCPDAYYEGNESVTITITGTAPSLSMGANAATTINIVEASPPPTVSFALASSGTIVEGNAGSTVVPVDVALTYPSVQPVTVKFLTAGTATRNTDYTLSATSLTIPAGSTTGTIFVTIQSDLYIELNETIILYLTEPVNAALGPQTTNTIVIDDDETPNTIQATMLGIATQAESAGTVNMQVQITGSTDHATTLQYIVDLTGAISTAPYRAGYGTSGDFYFPGSSTISGTLTVPAFTSGILNIPIVINDDAIHERSEAAMIRLLGGPEITVTGLATGELLITDNDLPPRLTFALGSQTVSESNTVQGAVIRLMHPTLGVEMASGEDVVIGLAATNGTANAVPGRIDYSLGISSITIPAGATRITVPFSVMLDLIDEENEDFTITLTPPAGYSAIASGDTHTVTILDVDGPPRINFIGTNTTVAENGALAVSVELDALTERVVGLNYSISGISASTAACSGSMDMTAPGTLSIASTGTGPFVLTGLALCNEAPADAAYEGTETAVISFSGVTNAIIGAINKYTVVITDEESAPSLDISASTLTFDEAAVSANFTLTVGRTDKPFTISYTTTGTATSGVDHTLASSGIINVAASTTSQNIPLSFSILDDLIPEDAETIVVTINAASIDATMGTSSAQITINASDPLQLALGTSHSCGLLSGRVKCWGERRTLGFTYASDYGDAALETVSSLQAINLGTGFTPVKVIAGDRFSCALSSAGAVKCWGANNLGQLGQDRPGVTAADQYIGDVDAEMGNALPAVKLGGVAIDIQTSPTSAHVCALLSSKRMKCWGLNNFGQAGVAPVTGSCSDSTPGISCVGNTYGDVENLGFATFPNAPGATVVRMAVGENHSCAQLSTNRIQCWGNNTNGGLGVDSADPARYLHTTPYASDVTLNAAFNVATMLTLSAGAQATCATFNNSGTHEALCWGAGTNGLLGRGSSANVGDAPGSLSGTSAPITTTYSLLTSGIKLGLDHACLRGTQATNQVRCWGESGNGALGVMPQVDTNLPSTNAALTSYSDIYTGASHTCGVVGAFRFVCWGSNNNGNAGVGASGAVNVPGTSQLFL